MCDICVNHNFIRFFKFLWFQRWCCLKYLVCDSIFNIRFFLFTSHYAIGILVVYAWRFLFYYVLIFRYGGCG